MSNSKKARKYNSTLLQELFDEITPLEMEQARYRMQLAACIEDLMFKKGWNKSQLAKNLDRNPSEITKWLSGTHNFTMNVLVEIAFVFGVDIAALFEKKSNAIQVIFRKDLMVRSASSAPQIPHISFVETIDHYPLSIKIGQNQRAHLQTKTLLN